MTTFARIVSGYTTDIQISATATELAARFHPDWLAAHQFIVVPDGTSHGAKDNGDGTFSAPVISAPILADFVLARSDFIDHCVTQFGGNARFGAVIVAAKTATDGVVGVGYEKYSAVSVVTKQQAQQFFTAIRAAGLPAGSAVTVAEITAVVTNWPKG